MKNELIISKLNVNGSKVSVIKINNEDYISLTDLARYVDEEEPSDVIRNWMSNRNSFLFYSLWEEINNKNFNSVKSHGIKINEVPYSRFSMTPTKWQREFNSIGIIAGSGKYSKGTFAHSDIAFEFASWLSPEFKLYLITEFQRLKKSELNQYNIEWKANRLLSKVNYLIHTDAINNYIIPTLTDKQKKRVYSSEADLLNVALFGMTAKEFKENNPNIDGNIRDNADLLHLIILSNLESINSELIKMGLSQKQRVIKLNNTARNQIEVLKNNKNIKLLENIEINANASNLIENK